MPSRKDDRNDDRRNDRRDDRRDYTPPSRRTREYTPPRKDRDYTPPSRRTREYTPPRKDRDYTPPPRTRTKGNTASSKLPPKSRVEVHQPTTEVWDYENHWQNDFADCCSSCKMWMCAFCCTPCFMAKLFMRTNECCLMCMLPGSLMALRAKLRTGFRIKGSLCMDCMATTICPICTAIQMTQELDKQEL